MAQNPFTDPNYGADAASAKPQPKNPFADPDYGKEPLGRSATDYARDAAAWAVKGAIAVPEAAVGAADLVSGGRAGKALENEGGTFGLRFKQAREVANDWHSDATKEAQRKFQEAEGLGGKFKAAVENPSNVVGAIVESLPAMGAGATVARGLLGATRLGQMGTRGAVLAGAAGEGGFAAGSAAEQIRQETEDGLLTPGQAAAGLATGVTTAVLGYAGGRVAQRLGIGDADTMLAQGNQGIAKQFADEAATAAVNPLVQQRALKGIPRQVIEGAISEGFLEELPQSVAEQVLQNLALGKDWSEGVDEAVVLGTLSGATMGGGAAGYRAMRAPRVGAPGAEQPGTGEAPAADPAAPPVASPGLSKVREEFMRQLKVQQEPVIDEARLREQGITPAPQLDTARIDAAITPPRPSEAMGLDPAAGSLSTAAALAVDSGASDQIQQAAILAQAADADQVAKAPTKKGDTSAGATAAGVDADTGELGTEARAALVQERLAYLAQQGRAHGWSKEAVAERNALRGELEQLQPPVSSTSTGVLNGAQAAQALAPRAQPSQAAGAPGAPAAAVAQAAGIQQAGATPGPAAQGLTDGSTSTPNPGAQAAAAPGAQASAKADTHAQRAARMDAAGAAWTRMPESERTALAGRVAGLKSVLRKSLPGAQWANLNVDLQRKLADAMTPQSPASAAAPVPTAGEQQARAIAAEGNEVRRAQMLAASERWTSMPATERQAVAKAAKGLNAPARAGAHTRAWADLAPAVREKLAAAMPDAAAAPAAPAAPATAAPVAAPEPAADAVTAAAQEAATSDQNDLPAPTEAQIEKGNYRKGHVRVAGLEISIENPAGSRRRPEWPPLQNHYGYIKGSVGADKDHVDVFLTDRAHEPDLPVFVVDQVNRDGSFDEHKVVMGAVDEADARATYLGNYEKGWSGLGAITQMTQDGFKAWVRDADQTKKPVGVLPESMAHEPSAQEFPLREAAASYSGISHQGTTRANSDREAFESFLTAQRNDGLSVAKTEAQKAAVETEMQQLREEYLQQYRMLMGVRAGTYSGFVAGRSGLNSKQAGSRNSALDRAMERFASWESGATGRARKAALAARTPAEVQAAQEAAATARQEKDAARLAKDLALVGRVLDWKKGDRSEFAKGTTLVGVNKDRAGYPSSVLLEPADGTPLVDNKFDLAGLLRRKAESVPGSRQRVRDLVNQVRAERGQIGTENSEAATKRPRGILAKKAAAEEAARADYFTPGNIVKGYGDSHARVVAYTPANADGVWSVTVREVEKQGSGWVDVPGQRERTHATPPSARELKAGPVDRVGELVNAAAEPEAPAAAAAAPVPSASKTPTVDAHLDLMKRVRAGEATADEYRQSFERTDAGQQAMAAELSTLKKENLLRSGGYSFAQRYRSDKKDVIVQALVNRILDEYALGRSYGSSSYVMSTSGLAAHRKAQDAALRELVANTTDEDLQQHAQQVAAARTEAAGRKEAHAQTLANPQTLADFRAVMRHHIAEGETRAQAFLRLTPEQRASFDALEAESTRETREQAKAKLRTKVATAGQLTTGEVVETKHTKHGHDLFVVQLAERVSREDYETLNASAKRMGGSYSSYRGNGAVPGFQFRTREVAEAFGKLVAGDSADAQAVAQARRDAFDDDRNQSAVERLRTMAQALHERADESLGRERKANTDRRARMAASADAAARADKALAGTMENLAQAIEDGKAKFLDAVRQKLQVEFLAGELRSAKDAQIRAKYRTYGEQERHRGEPVDAETVDFSTFPTYTAMRSDLAALGRQMLEVDGAKKLGARLMSVADDVSDAYTDWAKQNLRDVSHFGMDGGMAEFGSREDAERAIRRSGIADRAIVLPIKRGQNRVVLSPSEAMKRGLWNGDGDKRITLSSEFGAELVEAVGRRAGGAIRMPWVLEAAHAKRKRLHGLGVFTGSEYRAALREFAGIQEAIATPNKIKEMERAMVGRRADGLDFFPTSAEVVDSMLSAADIQPGMAVLEPSAGMGHIADAIREHAGVEPDLVELSGERRELLEAKGYTLVGSDFTAMKPRAGFTYGDVFRDTDGTLGVMRGSRGMASDRVGFQPLDDNGQPDARIARWVNRDDLVGVEQRDSDSGYDRIVMNPPFSKGRDIQHVRHAFELLRPGGRLVAIMGEGAFFHGTKAAEDFRTWLDEMGATTERLPEGSFMDPALPVNTGVHARMVVIDKPAGAQEKTDPSFRRTEDAGGLSDDQMADLLRIMRPEPAAFSDAAQAQAVSLVRETVDAIRAGWANGPEVIVAFDMDDPAVPAAARRADLRQRSGGASGAPEGFYWRGKAYLLASKLHTPADAARVLHHEVLGHHGLRGMFGRDLDNILNQVATMRRAEVAAKIKEYGLRGVTDLSRRHAAEEVLAEMAEKTPQLHFVRRAVAAIRNWLRTNVPGFKSLNLSDGDIIQAYILPARGFVEQGRSATVGRSEFAFSRTPEAATDFVLAPDGALDFGEIDAAIGRAMRRQSAPIRLRVGDAATGLRHIERRERLSQIQAAGYESVAAFVSDVAQHYDAVHRGRGASLFLVKKADKPNRTLVVQLEAGPEGDFYDVRTALVSRPDFMAGKEVLWERAQTNHFVERAPSAISGQSTGSNVSEDQGGEQEDSDDPVFSRSRLAELKDSALEQLQTTFSHSGKISLWHKTVGTMRNVAERMPAFKPVFESAQRFIDDVSMLANDAANAAPRLLPRVDSWKDLAKKPITAADNKAVAAPLFEGTLLWGRDVDGTPMRADDLATKYQNLPADDKAQLLLRAGRLDDRMLRAWRGLPLDQYEKLVNSRFESQMLKAGVVWTDAELKTLFKASQQQIDLYREARAAIDRSIDMTARADMLRVLGDEYAGLRELVLAQATMHEALEVMTRTLQDDARSSPDAAERLLQLNNQVVTSYERAKQLQDDGYAPLSRFGRYTLDVVDQAGQRQFFGMYESARESNLARIQMAQVFPGATITPGTMSQQDYKLFAGITPESLEQFGAMLGLQSDGDEAKDKAFQEYLQKAKNNHSALKRLIHRKGIAGYSQDVGRVLAGFVYSNARLGAGGLNAGTMEKSIGAIPKDQGELRDLAMGLRDYIQNPQEEGQAVRGMLFAQYLGGSLASAVVNMTQPFAVTLPWLTQYGGMKKAGAQMVRALNDMRRSLTDKGFKYEPELASALQAAEDDGVVSPQEIHMLMAQARGTGSLRTGDGTRAGDARAAAANNWERVKVAWGQPFALAEQFNRRSTFITAFRMAKEQGMPAPADFARKAVLETQFLYSKANKMRFARGAVGGALMTFKNYSVSYLELLHRMWTQGGPEGKRAVAWAAAMLVLMGGAGGLPFMEDLEDLIDGVGQMMGYNISAKQWRKQLMADAVGKELADFMEQGISGLPGAPIDVSGRLGMGNLIPGTGLALTKQGRERDLLELAGPAGDLVARGFSGARDILKGAVSLDAGTAARGAMEWTPTAVRNMVKGADMAASGMYKDTKGYKVIDTSLGEAAAKFIGFQPKSVAEVQEANSFMQRTKSFYAQTSSEIKAQWADALFRKDEAALQRVRERLAAWNRDNPDQPIVVRIPDVMKRVREMSKDKADRIADTAPKALRAQMREMAADLR